MTRNIQPPVREWVGPSPNIMRDADGVPLNNMPLARIVIHCTVSPCVAGNKQTKTGGRYTIASIFRQRIFKSAHYVADPGGIVQVVNDSDVAEHAPPNMHSIGIEMTDPLVSPAWDKKYAKRWDDPNHEAMLVRTARLVARLGLAYHVPLVRIQGRELHTHSGICGHADVSKAFGETDHWDPGESFPWMRFMRLVHYAGRELTDR